MAMPFFQSFIVGIKKMSAVSTVAGVSGKSSTLVQSAFAMLFGVFMIGAVGFSHIDVIHNAAHDTRHANAFPCH